MWPHRARFVRIVRIEDVAAGIRRTNSTTPFARPTTLSDAIADREITGRNRDLLAQVAEQASTRQDRCSNSEVKFVASVSVADLERQADQLSKTFRELGTRIQELNWKTDVT